MREFAPVPPVPLATPASIGRRWRKYAVAFRVSVANQLAYPGAVWTRSLFLLLIMFIFSSLWHTTYAETGAHTLGDFTLPQMLWYLAITESIILSRPRETLRLDEEIRTGSFAYALARPFSFVLYRFAESMGERVVRLGLNLLIGLPLAWLFAGRPGVTWTGLAAASIALVLGVSIDYLLVLIVQTLAFWVENTASLLFIYERFLMILGGMLLPLSLFPAGIATVARFLPFAAIISGPAQTAVAYDAGEFSALLVRQGVSLVCVALLASVVFRHGVRRTETNGG